MHRLLERSADAAGCMPAQRRAVRTVRGIDHRHLHREHSVARRWLPAARAWRTRPPQPRGASSGATPSGGDRRALAAHRVPHRRRFVLPSTAGGALVPEGFVAFSLRLGENTTHTHTDDRPQALPTVSTRGPLMAWNWMRATGDFAYPLSLNGHVMRTELVISLLARTRFSSPNLLEGALHVRRARVPPLMLAFRQSCVVSVPVNVVNTSTRPNRAGRDPRMLGRGPQRTPARR